MKDRSLPVVLWQRGRELAETRGGENLSGIRGQELEHLLPPGACIMYM